MGDKIPYGVPKHMLSHLQAPEQTVEDVTPPTGDLWKSMQAKINANIDTNV